MRSPGGGSSPAETAAAGAGEEKEEDAPLPERFTRAQCLECAKHLRDVYEMVCHADQVEELTEATTERREPRYMPTSASPLAAMFSAKLGLIRAWEAAKYCTNVTEAQLLAIAEGNDVDNDGVNGPESVQDLEEVGKAPPVEPEEQVIEHEAKNLTKKPFSNIPFVK